MQHYQSREALIGTSISCSWVQHVKTKAGNLIPCHTVKVTSQIQHYAENYGTKPLKVVGPLLKIRKENPNTYN